MGTLTDRYVSATVRELAQDQREDVDRELRGTIEDMVEARLDAGSASDREAAEHDVLVELGDPIRLAAGYTGRPLHLIGPALYPEWRRLVTVLLAVVVPIAAVGTLVVRLFVDDVATDGVGPAFGSAALAGLSTALHIAFWTTLVFAILERTQPGKGVMGWTPEQLPDAPDSRRSVSRGETVGSLVALLVMVLALVWQQVSSPVRLRGEEVPVLDPDLWTGWLPVLLALLVAQAVLVVAVHRAGRWTWGSAGVGGLLDVATAALLVWLLQTDRFFDGRFLDALVDGGWVNAPRDLTVGVTLGVLVVTVWDQVETVRRLRRG
ncbi:permease prefix domain 1-containing protein [Phycicoccus avicenniae]|uniref:permease prefix domain 1-containing protein n=1 Tax=Phycicoccus avicenniae TaxID=2828860 RepID=UPI003D284B65